MGSQREHLDLEIGTVDFDRAILLVDGEERRLRPMELRLLAYFAGRPDVVVSPADLLRDVWQYAAGVETRTVYATVNRLRLAIERDPTHPRHLLTVPRLGYRFRPLLSEEDVPRIGVLHGRDGDLARIRPMLQRGAIVTLCGAAGVGKSRVARELAGGHTGRVVRVDLAYTSGEEQVRATVAAALGVAPGEVDLHLAQDLDLLLLLDDADAAAPALARLLPIWPVPRKLVTSRAPLRVGGERVAPLGPLDTAAATALLDARVRERVPDLPLGKGVETLVPLLGGLPLAIELAAPWLLVMTPEELATRVGEELAGLRDPGGAQGRHGSIADALRWGWPLLDDAERVVLSQASVFAGSFDLAAARAVLQVEGVGEVLLRLVDRSWLRIHPAPAGQQLGFYAGEREFVAALSPPGPELRHRHLAHVRRLYGLAELEVAVMRGGAEWRRRVGGLADLRAARSHATGTDGVALSLALARMLLAAGTLDEAVQVLDGLTDAVDPPSRLAAVQLRAIALRQLGRAAEAREQLHDALIDAAAWPDLEGRLARGLGVLEMYHGDPLLARPHLERAEAVHRRVGLRVEAAAARAELGTWELLHGDRRAAMRLLEEALAVFRNDGATWACGVYLVNLAVLELMDEQLDSAQRHLLEALAVHRAEAAPRYEALALGNIARVQARRRQFGEAHASLDAAFVLARRAGDRAREGVLWSNRGLVHLEEGALADAGAALDRAASAGLQQPRLAVEVNVRRARLHAALGELGRARELLDEAEARAAELHLAAELRDARLAREELDRRTR